jgi:Domain of unknown function (DUF4249)
MKNLKHIILIIFILNLAGWNCKEVYTPPPMKNTTDLLVVDGIVIDGNDSTTITLSRTRSLADTATSVKEANAQVSVIGLTGLEYPLINQGNGRYVTSQLLLDITQKYQLKIITPDGNEFRSEMSSVYTSPPIDSVYWGQDSAGVHIYLNTHDPTNNTKYYRWQTVETWEYQSAFPSVLEYIGGGQSVIRSLDNQINTCYQSQIPSSIEVASTTQLSSDVVSKFEVATVPPGSEKISFLYSNLIKQYGIPQDAYNFWQNLKKNTEQLGTIFDLQPFTELGNITCVNNPSINCIGFISFSTLQQQRIFISKNQVFGWNYYPYYGQCFIDTVKPQDLTNYFQPDGGPYFNSLIGTNNGPYLLSSDLCVDCTYHGGTTLKPPFWP